MVGIVLGESPADDLVGFIRQLERVKSVLEFFRQWLASAVGEGIARSLGADDVQSPE